MYVGICVVQRTSFHDRRRRCESCFFTFVLYQRNIGHSKPTYWTTRQTPKRVISPVSILSLFSLLSIFSQSLAEKAEKAGKAGKAEYMLT
jgi:hypothetical protein